MTSFKALTFKKPFARSMRWIAIGFTAGLAGTALMSCSSEIFHTNSFKARAGDGSYGTFLAASYAQRRNDTEKASELYDYVLSKVKKDPDVLEKALTAKLGNGEFDAAAKIAENLSALEPDPQSAWAQMTLAVEAFKEDDYSRAVEILEQPTANQALPAYRQTLLAWAQSGNGQNKAAMQTLKDLAEDPNWAPYAGLYAGQIALGEDDAETSLALMNIFKGTIVMEEPNFALSMATALYRNEQSNDAIDLLNRISKQAPNNKLVQASLLRLKQGEVPLSGPAPTPQQGVAASLFTLGSAFSHRNMTATATIVLNLALGLDPNHEGALLRLAQVQESQGRYQQAVDTLARIDKDSPSSQNAEYNRIWLLARMEQFDQAISELKDMIEANPDDFDLRMTLGDLLRSEERYKEATTVYTELLDRIKDVRPYLWRAFYARGIAYERLQDWDKAEPDFLKALDLQPDQPDVLNYLGYTWVDKGMHLERALEMIRTAVRRRPTAGHIIDSLGWALYKMGDFEGAVIQLERAVALVPTDPTMNDHLGDAYWRVGRRQEAYFQWKRAINFDPSEEERLNLEAKLEKGLADPAIATIQK